VRLAPLTVALLLAQTPVDVTKIGPQVGATVADFTLKDQRGQDQSLAKAAGTKGTMLVFFRSADW
jgi:hypothetical protein